MYAAYSCACVRLKRVVDAASRSSKAPSKHPGAGLPLLAASSSLAIRAIARTNGLGKLGELGQPGSWGGELAERADNDEAPIQLGGQEHDT